LLFDGQDGGRDWVRFLAVVNGYNECWVLVTLNVSAELRAFDNLKPGDTIAAQYVEAVAFRVRTPAKK